MKQSQNPAPYANLGDKLKDLRERRKETIAEAAGAVEIAEDELQRIEEGYKRPSEEVLMLLINHFGMREDDAVQLWELAGYDDQDDDNDDQRDTRTIIMAIAMDSRVMYSDSVHVAGNPNGIVLSFLQPSIGIVPSMPISRVGMSREQARKMLSLIKDTLDALDAAEGPKRLPPSNDKPAH
jgi:transcriptional regulator with XRE-family HTH domain